MKREQARGTAHERGYTSKWAAYSRGWLARFPWCGMRVDGQLHAAHSRCVQQGQQVRATVTDHIRSMSLGGEQLDPLNSQSLCGDCNRRKAIALEHGFGR
jgi:5-methylcytosine-specific restriction endonuclease McrA